MDFADFSDTVNQSGDLWTEHPLQFFVSGQGILNGVVEKPGDHRRDIELQIGKYPRHFHRVDQVRFA